MKIIKYVCDRCGNEVAEDEIFRIVASDGKEDEQIEIDKDFCRICADKILSTVISAINGTGLAAGEAAEEKPETSDSDKTIKELLAAGKSTEEIVEIKGCSADSVHTARWQMKRDSEDGKNEAIENLDIPKVKALRKAKWGIHKIADEMGVEDDVIRGIVEGIA